MKSEPIILFHGTRPEVKFVAFDERFSGSGEGAGVKVGFYFATSLKGAANHAERWIRREAEPLVYVCRLHKQTIMLDRSEEIASQNERAVSWWKSQSHAFSCTESKDWFCSYFSHRERFDRRAEESEEEKCKFLRNRGLHAIYDFELSHTETYLHGPTVLVLAPEVIEIVEVLRVNDIFSETRGDPKSYVLANDKVLLGKTGVASYLRRA